MYFISYIYTYKFNFYCKDKQCYGWRKNYLTTLKINFSGEHLYLLLYRKCIYIGFVKIKRIAKLSKNKMNYANFKCSRT